MRSTLTPPPLHEDRAKFNLVLITGEQFRLTPFQFFQAITDKHSLFFFVYAGFFIGYLYPLSFLVLETGETANSVPWWQASVTLVVHELVLLAMLTIQIWMWPYLIRRWPFLVLPLPLVMVFSVLILETVKRQGAVIFYGDMGVEWIERIGFLQAFVVDYVYIFMLEVAYSMFVVSHVKVYSDVVINPRAGGLARIQREAREREHQRAAHAVATHVNADPTAPATPQPAAHPNTQHTISIAGETITLADLRAIRAEEHYIRLDMAKGEKMLRYRLADAVEQIPAAYGIQAHRSVWVAFGAIEKVTRLAEGKLLLTMTTNDRITVPRARRKAVEQALETFGG
ncbi:LytTR family DNA-binding domain-containing protein [Celeribacter marinus]|uniref:LytTR family DNA-binding domain-containing protein n=1 Tax=Celeribacter marinus TaxID=1397108 RepID=UPI0008F2D382|nr:LytTR family DNA-binding domain-containing protein [Celeribacter marinus]SFK30367.1 LytTr DNA-binding domain-containing protein [Celeribacter marinus]